MNEIARVRLNGADLGAARTLAWGLQQPKENLRVGENVLSGAVTNVWANRLIGDAGLASEERITQTNVQYFPSGGRKGPYAGICSDGSASSERPDRSGCGGFRNL